MVETITIDCLNLDSGKVLADVPVAYRTWGRLNEAKDNAIVVCHALTGDTNADDWWAPLIGPGRVLDTDRYFVVCPNVPGSPYGSASPITHNPATGAPYGPDFPVVTVRDAVRLHRRLLDHLGVRQVAMAIGGSMGGMQVLEWAFFGPYVRAIVPIGVGGRHSAWAIGWSEAQRQTIYADPNWRDGRYDADHPPAAGLAAARMAAMISYRSWASFEQRFGRQADPRLDERFAVEGYLRYQGEKLVRRFDANCYIRLTQLMDTHDVAAGRGAYPDVLARIRQPALVIGINSDILYPLEEQQELAKHMPNAELAVLHSVHGHDAFLIEFDQLEALLRPWMAAHVEGGLSHEAKYYAGYAI